MKKIIIMITLILLCLSMSGQSRMQIEKDLSGKYYDTQDSLTMVIKNDTVYFNEKVSYIMSATVKSMKSDRIKYELAFVDADGEYITMGLTKKDSVNFYMFATDFRINWLGRLIKK